MKTASPQDRAANAPDRGEQAPDPEHLLRVTRDAYAARLLSLAARRAELVGHVLEIAAKKPQGEELTRELEAIVDHLVALDLRPLRDDAGAEGVRRSARDLPHDPVAVDAVLVATSPIAQVRRALLALESRTPALRSLQLVEHDGGAPVSALREIAEPRDGWHVAPRASDGGSASPPELGTALEAGTADLVVVLTSETIVSFRWSDRLAAALAADEQLGVVHPLTNAAGAPGELELPLESRLGPDGIAEMLGFAALETLPTIEAFGGPCWMMRRATFEAVGAPDGTRWLEQDEQYATRVRAKGWRIGVSGDAFVAYTGAARRPDEPGGGRLRRGRRPPAVAPSWTAPAVDLVREVSAMPQLLGQRADRLGPPPRVAYVVNLKGSGSARQVVTLEADALRQSELPAELLLVGDDPSRVKTPWARHVHPGDLDEALDGTDVTIATGGPAATEILAAAERAGSRGAYLLTDRDRSVPVPPDVPLLTITSTLWETLPPDRRATALPLPPVFDDRVLRPLPDSEDADPRFTVLVAMTFANAKETLEALEQVRRTLGDQVNLLTMGPRASNLVERGCPSGSWQESHHVPPGDAALAALMNRADVYVNVAPNDRSGRTLLSAMGCGAVPVAADDGAAIEIAGGSPAVITVPPGDTAAWMEAVIELATHWSLLQRSRHAALAAAAQHGLAAASASRHAVLRRLIEDSRPPQPAQALNSTE